MPGSGKLAEVLNYCNLLISYARVLLHTGSGVHSFVTTAFLASLQTFFKKKGKMLEDNLIASFEPTDTKLLSSVSQSHLLVQSPILASALSNIFPYLLFIDNVLEIVTWTNEDVYLNFLIVTTYSVLVLNWFVLSHWILPISFALTFSSVVWNASSVLHDAKFGEKPTIDEVLLTLHNITARFELLLRPAKHVSLSTENFRYMLVGATLFTPLHFAMLRYVIRPQTYVWLFGVICLTYHSPYSFAVRRLLWRSAYLRRLVHYLTGLSIRLTRSDYLLRSLNSHETLSRTQSHAFMEIQDEDAVSKPNRAQTIQNFTILKKVIVSPLQLRQTVRFDILENERRWIGFGWCKYVLPSERAKFTYATLMAPAPNPFDQGDFKFPMFENDLYTYQWHWIDDTWTIDPQFSFCTDKSGWTYYDKNWAGPTHEDSFSRYTRSRRWTRRATLVIDKLAEVYDGLEYAEHLHT